MMVPRFTFAAFLATTLDGFISRPDGTMDFLDAANETMTPGEDCGIASFLASVDAIVMGRHTFLHIISTSDKSGWMYGNIPLYVMSQTLEELPSSSPPSVKLLRTREIGDVVRYIGREEDAKSAGTKVTKVYVDGGEMVRSFMRAKLLEEITITVIPRLIGEGRPLFGQTPDIDLVLRHCKYWDFGFVQSCYGLKY